MEAGPHLDALSETHASGRTEYARHTETKCSGVARANGAKLSAIGRSSHLVYLGMT